MKSIQPANETFLVKRDERGLDQRMLNWMIEFKLNVDSLNNDCELDPLGIKAEIFLTT